MEHLNLDTFQEEIFELNETLDYKSNIPSVIDFYADWCAPCKRMEPSLNELEKEYEGKVKFFKINVDENYELSSVFGIKSIPTVMYCPTSNGVKKDPVMVSGLKVKDDIKNTINKIFNL